MNFAGGRGGGISPGASPIPITNLSLLQSSGTKACSKSGEHCSNFKLKFSPVVPLMVYNVLQLSD